MSERIFPTDAHGNPLGPARDEIVRCRDCWHFNGWACKKSECTCCGEYQRVKPDWFCALGERVDI